jgi:hypothetical protein
MRFTLNCLEASGFMAIVLMFWSVIIVGALVALRDRKAS